MLGITRRTADKIKPGSYEVSGMVLPGGSFEGAWDGNLEGEGPVYSDPLGNS